MKRHRPQILTVTDERGRLISARVHAVHPMPRRLQRALKAVILAAAKLTRAELVEIRRKRLTQAESGVSNLRWQRARPARRNSSSQPVTPFPSGLRGAATFIKAGAR